MAKPVYEENELRATRERLDIKDEKEAKFMMKVLGGEVGEVRSEKPNTSNGDGRNRTYVKSAPLRRIETVEFSGKGNDSHDNIYIPRFFPKEFSRSERIKMDSQEADSDFKIKTWFQAFRSKLAFFSSPRDTVSRVFVVAKMEDYFLSLNKLVNKVRLILPRNNTSRNKKFKQYYPFAFSILDTIRYWNIEKISSSLARLQTHPRAVVVSDFAEIIKEFYRPLVILEMLDAEEHIAKAVSKLDYMLEDESDNHITLNTSNEIVSLFDTINEDICWRLYPFLLKFTSNTYIPYDSFFNECKEEIRGFVGVTSGEIIQPDRVESSSDFRAGKDKEQETEEASLEDDSLFNMPVDETEEKPDKRVLPTSKPKAVQRGLNVLEQLFPEAGWEKLDTFPDIYHYYAKLLSLKKNADVIDPENPMLQALVLMQILDELFYGFRSISFNSVSSSEASFDLAEFLDIIDEWHKLIDNCFERMYLPRLSEFVKLFYNPIIESKQKIYAMKLREELNWQARLFLFPSLKIDSFLQTPIHKKDVTAVFPKVRILRQSFTVIAAEIEKALQEGGISAHAHCAAINNPWDQYVFQVANPLSKRLNMLLDKENRTNVSLIYYTLSVLTVLDYLINNPHSWAYQTNTAKLFRSSDVDGIIPESLPEISIDADAVFKQRLEKLKAQKALE